MNVLTTSQMFKRKKEVEDVLEEYRLDRSLSVEKLADSIEVTRAAFLSMFNNYLLKFESEKALVEKQARKPKKHLSPAQRDQLIEAVMAGAFHTAVAKRFDVSVNTVGKIMSQHRIDPPTLKASTLDKEPELNLLHRQEDMRIFFEGDDLVIRIRKTNLTRELLKAVL